MSPLHFLPFLSVLPRTDTPRLFYRSLKTINPLGIPEIQNIVLSFVSAALPFDTDILCINSTFYQRLLLRLYYSIDLTELGRLRAFSKCIVNWKSKIPFVYDLNFSDPTQPSFDILASYLARQPRWTIRL